MNSLQFTTKLSPSTSLELVQGDITSETTDAIVNAANENLIHEAGVAGAISKGGGPKIQMESNAWVQQHGPVSHAKPAWTTGGILPCRYVIHAVGPIWGEGDEDEKLDAAITGSLRLAEELRLISISFPAISTGIFGFPEKRAADIIIKCVQDYFQSKSASGIKTVRLVMYDSQTFNAFQKAWHDHIDA